MLDIHCLDEHPLNALPEIWIDRIRKDCQFPRLLVSPDIPCLDIVAAAIIIRRDVTNIFVDYRVYLRWCETFCRGQLGQEQRQQKNDGQSNQNLEHLTLIIAMSEAKYRHPWSAFVTAGL
jgi:hypothetical protein